SDPAPRRAESVPTSYRLENRPRNRLGTKQLGLERIEQAGPFLIGDFDSLPIKKVGSLFALDFAHETTACMGPRIFGWFQLGFLLRRGRPQSIAASESQTQAALRINMMILEVLRLKPWIAPLNSFAFAKFTQQKFFTHPIHHPNE